MSELTLERRGDGRVALLRFDRGTRANPLALSTMRALTEAAEALAAEPALAAVVLAGRDDHFSFGFDLKDAETAALAALPLAERRRAVATGRRMCAAFAALDCLTVSAVSGRCVGGGLALAAATDLRVAAPGAIFSAPEVERGFNMSWGSVPRLVALVGPARAKRMLVLAEPVPAETALAWGLADEIAEDPVAAALALAERAAAMPPVPARMIKRAVDAFAFALAETASWADADQFALAQGSDDGREAAAAFAERRPPRFTGG